MIEDYQNLEKIAECSIEFLEYKTVVQSHMTFY